MPCVPVAGYHAPFWLRGGRMQTIAPVLLHRAPAVSLRREIVETPDDDFFEVDFSHAEGEVRGVAIVSHGLEGHSHRSYMLGMCRALHSIGLDCALRNFRGCGGRMNRRPFLYHSGQTDDLRTLVAYCLALGYKRIVLVGFSMGGNQTLKYLGEDPTRVPAEVRAAAVFSVPVDLTSCAEVLDNPSNSLYMWYFLKTLRLKVREKHRIFPDLYPLAGLEAIRTFAEFDGRYTAPLNGFASAADYWRRASSLPFLAGISVPTLLVNARNDPFLAPPCFPVEAAERSAFLHLERPEEGGHLGFVTTPTGPLWLEARAAEFLQDYI